MQPPRFGRPAAPRKSWERPGKNARRRLRGRAGVEERRQILAEEPLCRPCLADGRVTASAEVDHIDEDLPDPLWDARENKQGICKPCHRAKTAASSTAARRANPDL
jgi:5-methylcytosine-specific restriction enzyme A